VVQGALEQSNVKPVIAMTLIADIVRAYQQTSTTMQNEHERQRTALRTLGRVTG
jgi:flagellar basal body rod protein FlgG